MSLSLSRREVVAGKVLDRHHGVARPQDEEFQAKVALHTSYPLLIPLPHITFPHARRNPCPGAVIHSNCCVRLTENFYESGRTKEAGLAIPLIKPLVQKFELEVLQMPKHYNS